MVTKKKATTKKIVAKKIASPVSSKKKEKAKPIDGYGTVERTKLRNAVRQIWQRSKAWKVVKSRCLDDEGYPKCEQCNLRVPKIFVDHTVPIGDMEDPGFFERLMVSSEGLKGLCKECHAPKTKKDNLATKEKKKVRKENAIPFPQGIENDIVKDADEMSFQDLDADIQEMDIFSYQKFKLQGERNTSKVLEHSLDLFI